MSKDLGTVLWMSALGLIAATSACGNQGSPADASCEVCGHDPLAHCVQSDNSCSDQEDCPLGSMCKREAADAISGECQIPDGTENFSNILISGFGVAEFPKATLNRPTAQADNLVLEWSAPDHTRAVACALFMCPPALRERDDGRKTIANFDRCVLRSMSTGTQDGSFDLRALENDFLQPLDLQLPDCEPILAPQSTAAITSLLAGCWAYDDASIIAATKLFAVDIADLRASIDLIARGPNAECTLQDDWRTCTHDTEPNDILGTCVQGVCRARCLDDADCIRDNQTCEFSANLEFLGTCSTPGPVPP